MVTAPSIPRPRGGQARRQIASPVPSGFSSIAGTGAQEFARGLEQFGQELQAEARDRDNHVVVKGDGMVRRRVDTRVAELDPTSANYTGQVADIIREERQGVGEELEFETDDGRAKFDQVTESVSQALLLNAQQTRREGLRLEAEDLFAEKQNEAFANIKNDPDNFQAHLAAFKAQEELIGGRIPEDRRRDLNEAAEDAAIVAAAEGFAQQGRFDEAREFLKANEGELDPNVAINAGRRIREIENLAKNDAQAKLGVAVANISVGVVDATTTSELTDLRTQVDSLQGAFEAAGIPGQRAALIRSIENRRRQIVKDGADLSTALTQFESGQGLNGPKQTDLVYGEHLSKLPEDATQSQKMAVLTNVVKRAGHVPTRVRRVIENAEHVENPDTVAAAAFLHDTIKAAAPRVDTGAGDFVAITSARKKFTDLSYEEAANLTITGIPDKPTLDQRREQFKEDFAELDLEGDVNDAVGVGFFSGNADVPARVQEEYQKRLQNAYDLTGDAEVARSAAQEQIAQTHGVTEVGGERRVTKFPAESLLPLPAITSFTEEDRAAIVDADVQEALNSLPENARPDEVDDPAMPPYRLWADKTTDADAAAGRPVSYELRVRKVRQDGIVIMAPILDTQTGGTVRWTVPTTEEMRRNPAFKAKVEEFRQQAAPAGVESLEDPTLGARGAPPRRREPTEPSGFMSLDDPTLGATGGTPEDFDLPPPGQRFPRPGAQ